MSTSMDSSLWNTLSFLALSSAPRGAHSMLYADITLVDLKLKCELRYQRASWTLVTFN